MDQSLETGLARVKVSRPRPAYKGIAQSIEDSRNMWRKLAYAVGVSFIVVCACCCWLAHKNMVLRARAADSNVTTIVPGAK